jgi:hypothetical protein
MKFSKTIWIVTLGLFSTLTYFAWTNRKIEIKKLQSKIVDFRELPPVVADIFRNTKKYRTPGQDGSLLTTDSINDFRFEVSETGPWTDYYIIIKNDKKKFKVPYGKPFPFVIHDNELFIPDRFNVANTQSAEEAMDERYRLED